MRSEKMSALSNLVALEINGEAVSLADVLRRAKMRGELQLVDDAIDAALIRHAAAEHGITVSDDELQRAADDFRVAYDLYTPEETKRWLSERHLTIEDWESLLESDLIRHKLREALTADKVEPHFVEHKLSFDSAAISRIVVRDEDLARELRAQIVEDGLDFYALARQYSMDEVTKPAGGYSGRVRRMELEAAVESAVFGARPGKIVGPFKTDDGWQLIKIESLHPAILDDSTREEIRALLFDEWLSERRRKARISIPLLEESETPEHETAGGESVPVE